MTFKEYGILVTIMVFGRDIRLNRITNEGKMLCIPMDHGLTLGPIQGLESAHTLIYSCESAGLTCVLVNKGIAKSMPRPTSIRRNYSFVRDTLTWDLHPIERCFWEVLKRQYRLGADAVSVHINVGAKEEPEMLQMLGTISDKCDERSVPLVAMMYARGENVKDPNDPEVVGHGARIGAEAGADLIKVVYTGDVSSFKKVVKGCPVPIVIAGGPKVDTDKEILDMCHDAMKAGAERCNIW